VVERMVERAPGRVRSGRLRAQTAPPSPCRRSRRCSRAWGSAAYAPSGRWGHARRTCSVG
jgi:hypothetical protein